jgi:hypothetical protein
MDRSWTPLETSAALVDDDQIIACSAEDSPERKTSDEQAGRYSRREPVGSRSHAGLERSRLSGELYETLPRSPLTLRYAIEMEGLRVHGRGWRSLPLGYQRREHQAKRLTG